MKRKKKNLLEDLMKRLASIKAKDIMTKDVITTRKDTHLADLAEIMIKSRISGLPVVGKAGKVTGIITAKDLFILMDMIKSGDIAERDELAAFNPTVEFGMSSGVIKIRKNTSLEEIIVLMKYKNAHTLPVFEGKKMVGVIGRRDVFKSFYSVVKELYG